MSDILTRDDLLITVNRLMICAMEDIDCGRNEAGPTTLDLVGRIERHDAGLRTRIAELEANVTQLSDGVVAACLRIDEMFNTVEHIGTGAMRAVYTRDMEDKK